MVALRHNLPLIQNSDGVVVAFDGEWLRAALEKAARKAGYDAWGPLDEISQTVAAYLREAYPRCVIKLRKLDQVVRTTLRDVGYHEIATRFRTVHPYQCMSLTDCLDRSPAKRESAFFRRLAERIDGLHAAQVQHFHFHDLHACVERLLEAEETESWWGEPMLQERIVGFVRERLRALSWRRPVQCTIR